MVKTRIQRLILISSIVLVPLYFSLYWLYYELGIFCVEPGEFGELIWCGGPPGRFFPLPQESGMLAAISPHESLIDYVFYYVLIYTKLVYVFPPLLWIADVVLVLRMRSPKETIVEKTNTNDILFPDEE